MALNESQNEVMRSTWLTSGVKSVDAPLVSKVDLTSSYLLSFKNKTTYIRFPSDNSLPKFEELSLLIGCSATTAQRKPKWFRLLPYSHRTFLTMPVRCDVSMEAQTTILSFVEPNCFDSPIPTDFIRKWYDFCIFGKNRTIFCGTLATLRQRSVPHKRV